MNKLEALAYWLEETDLAIVIGETWLFPAIESLHVIGAVFVLGAIAMADLRMLGLAGNRYPLTTFVRELVPWSAVGFLLAVITGVGMFITRASSYLDNAAFLWKMFLLLLAGLNIAYFHRLVFPRLGAVNQSSPPPLSARINGASSLLLWLGVMLAGRWTGHIF